MSKTNEEPAAASPDDTRSASAALNTYWLVSERQGADGKKDIHFQVQKTGCPAAQQQIKNGVERTLSTLRIVYPAPDDPKFSEAFAKLLGLSRVGLVGPNSDPVVVAAALESLHNEIVDREAGRVKNDYMLKLGGWALLFSSIAVAMYFVIERYPSLSPSQINNHRNFFLLWTGCMAGVWCSFATRKVILTFFDLGQLEEDRIDPPLRLLFSGLLTSILGLVFITGFANIVVGTFEAAKLLTDGSVALLVGALSGLAEKALPAAVLQKAQSLFRAEARGA